MIVRTMQPTEIDATIICFGYYRDEAIESLPKIAEEYDEDSMIETIRSYAVLNEACWFNAYEGQRVIGFIAGMIIPCPWNQDIASAHISFVYMLDSHRSMDNFKMLLNSFTDWAKMCKASSISGGDIGINLDRSRKLYDYLGFKEILHTCKEIA